MPDRFYRENISALLSSASERDHQVQPRLNKAFALIVATEKYFRRKETKTCHKTYYDDQFMLRLLRDGFLQKVDQRVEFAERRARHYYCCLARLSVNMIEETSFLNGKD